MPQLRALGGLELEPVAFTQPKPLLLLAYLALEGAQQRRHLAELFWPAGRSMKSLSMTLTRLKQGAGPVVAADDRRAWANAPSDAGAVLAALERSEWGQAAALYQGAFLEGVVLDDWSSELEEWVYGTREHLAGRVQHGLLSLAEQAAGARDFAEAGQLAERAYRLPGLSGSEPTSLRRLYRLLCAGSSALAPEVRREAESYGLPLQLTTERARADFAQESAELPAHPTSFIGREEELAEVSALMARPGVRLVSVVGPGGVGKTRLALELAHRARARFPGGLHVVPLDALSDPALLPATLSSHLGLTPMGDAGDHLHRAIGDRRMLLVLDNFEHLADGAETLSGLLSACPNLALLVTSRERLRLEEEHVYPLGGLPYPLSPTAPIPVGSAAHLFAARAQQVAPRFDAAANAAEIARICSLVDGLPLALELAAAWARLLPCRDIGDEIEANPDFLSGAARNAPERHRSLRAVFETSWRRLSDEQRRVLGQLSVFRGGFRREAAARVAGATIPVLAALVDTSLLRVSLGGRYDQHPLLHQFTRAKLAARPADEAAARAAQAACYLALAEQAEPHLRGRDQVAWLERLREEHDNLRLALAYLSESDPPAALTLALALGYFWETQAHYREGGAHLAALAAREDVPAPARARAAVLAARLQERLGDHRQAKEVYRASLASGVADPATRAAALLGLGIVAHLHEGEYEAARAHYQASLELARSGNDPAAQAAALIMLGTLMNDRADYLGAQRRYQDAADLYQASGEPLGRAKCLANLATVLTSLGETEAAHRLNEESLVLFRAVGDRHGEGVALLNLGMDASGRGAHAAGVALYQESLALFRELGEVRMASHLLNNLAGVYQTLREPYRSLPLLEESLAIQRRVGDVSLTSHALFLLGKVHRDLGEMTAARRAFEQCALLCRKNGENWALMRVLEAWAGWHMDAGDYPAAAASLREAEALAATAGDRRVLDKVAVARARLAAAEPPR